jgi:hypothetical protein
VFRCGSRRSRIIDSFRDPFSTAARLFKQQRSGGHRAVRRRLARFGPRTYHARRLCAIIGVVPSGHVLS